MRISYMGEMLRVGRELFACRTLDRALSVNHSLGNMYHVVFSMGATKFFTLMKCTYDTIRLPSELCMCEVVICDTARVFLDFDFDVSAMIDDISHCLVGYMRNVYSADARVYWKWSHGNIRRWHCIVTGVYFYQCWRNVCMNVCKHLTSTIRDLVVDEGVYRHNACLRMVGQFKLLDGKYVRRLHPYTKCNMSDLSVLPTDRDVKISESPSKPIQRIRITTGAVSVETMSKCSIPPGFKVGRVSISNTGDRIAWLVRIHPSHCQICRKVHNSVGAYIIMRHHAIELRCYRSRTYNNGADIPLVLDMREPC
jgi:hypothetical protein